MENVKTRTQTSWRCQNVVTAETDQNRKCRGGWGWLQQFSYLLALQPQFNTQINEIRIKLI